MPTIRFQNIEIEADTEEAVQRLYQTVLASQNIPPPDVSAREVVEVAEEIQVATGLGVIDVEEDLTPPPSRGSPPQPRAAKPPRPSEAQIRNQQREAAGKARDALAAKRRAMAEEKLRFEEMLRQEAGTEAARLERKLLREEKKAAEAAEAAAAAAAAVAAEVSDSEEGDESPGIDNEPQDYQASGEGAALPADELTSEQRRAFCLKGLQDVAALGETGSAAVKATVHTFGVTKIRDIVDADLDKFWIATAKLCSRFNVAFPPAG